MVVHGTSRAGAYHRPWRAALVVGLTVVAVALQGVTPRSDTLLSTATLGQGASPVAALEERAPADAVLDEAAALEGAGATEATPASVVEEIAPSAAIRAPAAQAACRPSTPAVEPTPGRSFIVERGPAECNTVALTFDAGADRGYAELILDILRDNGAVATFGMTGRWAEENPELVVRMAEEGHQVMNHTWSHRSFTGFSPQTRALGPGERRVELDRTEEMLTGLIGRSTRPYWRPPYGDINGGVLADAYDAGYDYTIMWTVDSLGWNKLTAREVAARCLERADPGSIMLFHVGADSSDAQALGAIIQGVRVRGLGFVTIADMLGL